MYCESNSDKQHSMLEVIREGDVIEARVNFKDENFFVECNAMRGKRKYICVPEMFRIVQNCFRFVLWWKDSSLCRIRLIESY